MSTEHTPPEDDDRDGEAGPADLGDGGAGRGDVDVTEAFDERLVDLLAWLLDTETRARIYVYLRANPHATSEEVATGTGLYPSTVREALAELHGERTVDRRKRQSAGAGNNPYEYDAIPPSELVSRVVDDVQAELNTVFNLDRYLAEDGNPADRDPVSITIDDGAE